MKNKTTRVERSFLLNKEIEGKKKQQFKTCYPARQLAGSTQR
jgi:hypothetical protein